MLTAKFCRIAPVLGATVIGLALAAASPAQAADVGGNVGLDWSIPGAPSGGLTNVTFPMTVAASTVHDSGTYFAQQYDFTNSSDVGYTGLQPRANRNGKERLRGVFSSFIAGTTSTDANCSDGADGGAGVSCAAEFDAVYGHTYNLTVARTGTDTWSGTATDTTTGQATHLGTYRLPAGSGNLNAREGGFVEYYGGWSSCDQVPWVNVTLGGPTSTSGGGLSGTTGGAHEYSTCVGQANYHATTAGRGVTVTRGWPADGGGGDGGDGGGGSCAAPGQTSTNPGLESGSTGWTATSGVVSTDGDYSRTGNGYAWLGGYGATHSDTLSQSVTIPASCAARLTYWVDVDTSETSKTTAYDKLTLTVNGTVVQSVSNLNPTSGYVQKSVDLSSYAGTKVTLKWTCTEDRSLETSFFLDDAAVTVS